MNGSRLAKCYRVEVLLGDKTWLNANQRLFWRVRSERTKAWRKHTAQRAVDMHLPHMQSAYILAELRFSTNARRDPANWAPTAKACVDGLVDAGVFDDDNYRHVTGPDMRIGERVPEQRRGIHLLIFPTERFGGIT
jgi:crossover junction endodeoxyribonuclease RusA